MIASNPKIKAIIGFVANKKNDKKIIIMDDVPIDNAKIPLFLGLCILLFIICSLMQVNSLS